MPGIAGTGVDLPGWQDSREMERWKKGWNRGGPSRVAEYPRNGKVDNIYKKKSY